MLVTNSIRPLKMDHIQKKSLKKRWGKKSRLRSGNSWKNTGRAPLNVSWTQLFLPSATVAPAPACITHSTPPLHGSPKLKTLNFLHLLRKLWMVQLLLTSTNSFHSSPPIMLASHLSIPQACQARSRLHNGTGLFSLECFATCHSDFSVGFISSL